MTRLPDEAEHRRRWAALEISDRRRIVRAVNRGERLEVRKDATLAVGLARKQQRFWARAWLLGPVIALVFARDGLVPYLANALVAGLLLGGMSWFWHRRAKRAERENLDVLGLAPRHDDAAPAPTADAEDDRAGTPPVQNPPKRSRAQRRKRR